MVTMPQINVLSAPNKSPFPGQVLTIAAAGIPPTPHFPALPPTIPVWPTTISEEVNVFLL